MFQKILAVCVGNICRSPTAEYLLKKQLPNHNIASAGIGALVGYPADAQATMIAARDNIDLSPHRAQQLTAEICAQYDLILVMEQKHIDAVIHICPNARSKTMLLGQWLPADNNKNIIDPYQQSDDIFQIVFDKIKQSTILWADKLQRVR